MRALLDVVRHGLTWIDMSGHGLDMDRPGQRVECIWTWKLGLEIGISRRPRHRMERRTRALNDGIRRSSPRIGRRWSREYIRILDFRLGLCVLCLTIASWGMGVDITALSILSEVDVGS